MPTLVEQLEAAKKDLETFADQLDKSGQIPNAEEQTALNTRMATCVDLSKAIKQQREVQAQLTDTATYLSSLSGLGGDVIKSLADVSPATLPGMPGLVPTPGGGQRYKTLGELFTESAVYSEFGKKYKGLDGLIPPSTKGINSLPFQSGLTIKSLVTGGDATSGGAFLTPQRWPSVTDLIGARELTLIDLVTRSSVLTDTVEYVQITGKTNNAAPVPEATSSAAIGDGTGGSATIITGGVKPESGLTLKVVSTNVKTIAHWMPITKRAASDAGQMRTLIDTFLREGIEEELEDQMANGDGTGENFLGILQTPGVLTVGSAGTDIDAVVDAIRTVRVQGRRRPNGFLVHPNDWFSTGFLLAKDTTGQYLMANPAMSVDQLTTLWGLAVVVSEAVPENTSLVGDFRQAVLWEREGITLSMTDSHADFFVRNILAILAEMRAAFGVLDPEAFCKITAV